MGICGRNRKPEKQVQEHKWIYVNLADFKSTSWWNYVAYIGIFLGIIISIACYAADIYTAVILIAFGRWTNKIEQQKLIDFEIARFIFCACIFVSFALLIVDWYFAIRDIRSDGVAEAYLNVIAVRWNCIWGGKDKGDTGWKRFLVFSKLTSSRGFVDYIALFTYFAFKGWLRIFLAEGPRVVINTLTFISVFRLGDLVAGHADGYWEKFWQTVQTLYKEDQSQVFVLATMAFTTIMWAFAVLRVLISAVLYICFLWHAMGNGVGLRAYCKERIDARMRIIVQKKSEKSLAEERKQRGSFLRQPTLPVLAEDGPFSSTSKLVPSPPESIMLPAVKPLDFTTREPVIPNIADLERGPDTPMTMRPPPPARIMTGRTEDSFSTASHRTPSTPYRTDTPSFREPRHRTPAPEPAPDEYQMTHLPRSHTPTTARLPTDRIPRNPTPPSATTWNAAPEPIPRSDTASPYASEYEYGYTPTPPPRSLTVQPQGYGGRNPRPTPSPLDFSREAARYEHSTPTFGPPTRSNTAGLDFTGTYSAVEPPRSHTAHPAGGYDNPSLTSIADIYAEEEYPPRGRTPGYAEQLTPTVAAFSQSQPPATRAPPAPYRAGHQTPTTPEFASPMRSNTAPMHQQEYDYCAPSVAPMFAPPRPTTAAPYERQPYTTRAYTPARYQPEQHPPYDQNQGHEGWGDGTGHAM